ncbi:MAG TPA: flagellar basal body P-ring protein FlgI [Candidatus Hydrogenedentes bacterium]|nr:flagellar basal body P-ring protein FlgI [Candidatus Hydrogenedentota bacterium]HOV72962.1 flagellar basal body P-ring protein FlgI [Candidatus Hydrogenedentota bacterium]HPC15808.1 flagellar basal body P-ring protein FlgI [Candidatus Hydrogenedentota bacterium]HRT19783.1 flagellar basal body P-ring protein FlgI [Candidatus Hydrogenedentota bacterium]HRT64557.1 flagellar basal body P-ring protein FlgI [Candidatus Hydrogenedentota bacterium]
MIGIRHTATGIALAALCALMAGPAGATRIKDLCEIQGARGNMLIGTGIVVGLAGTGDKSTAAITAQQRVMERLGIAVDSLKELKSDNAAIVMVTAELPAFAKEGTRIDVTVESVYDCKSLEGGTLLETYLHGPGDAETVYAVAQGPLSIGGFNATGGGGGGGVRKNHATAGRIPMGAFVEREAPSTITDGERLMLLLKRPDFVTADNIQNKLNEQIGPDCAAALGAGAINILIPEAERRDLVRFIARVQDIEVQSDMGSRVVINERTGTIVVGSRVMIKPCQVAHGNLTIKISTMPVISQPLPETQGQTVAAVARQTETREDEGFLLPVQGTSAGEVAEALNKLKTTPRDMISIFQALRQAGALEADLEIM